jgi:hypothetical protein
LKCSANDRRPSARKSNFNKKREKSTGAILPNDGNPWIYEKTVDLDAWDDPRIGASSLDIMAGIEATGYFL